VAQDGKRVRLGGQSSSAWALLTYSFPWGTRDFARDRQTAEPLMDDLTIFGDDSDFDIYHNSTQVLITSHHCPSDVAFSFGATSVDKI
jgi:hypothetical protein